MKDILMAHAAILKQIPQWISAAHGVRIDGIKLVNIETVDDNTMNFQLTFYAPSSEPEKLIALNFQFQDQAPHLLFFETLGGLKGYERAIDYHGLEKELLKYIGVELDE